MAQFDANINLVVNAQKAYKQIADLENRLDKLSNPKTKRQVQGLITQSKSDLKASEQRLANQVRLNAALERQANLVKGLNRSGVSGGRSKRVDELVSVGEKFKNNLRIQNAVNTALEKELQTLREINRTDRAQSATSSKILTSVKQRLKALKAVGATASEITKIEKKRDALVSQNARKQTDLAKESFSQLDRQLATLERKYSTFLGKPGRQIASPIRGGKNIPGSPAYLEEQARAADKAAQSAKRLADQQLRASKAAGGPRSPIGGSESLVGSPKFLAAQAKKLNAEELKINKTLDDQRKLRERNAAAAKKLAATQARNAKKAEETAKRNRQNRIQGLQLGVGFPLLFGGGVGSIAGGAFGALTDSSGGFGGQILFSALGQQIDTFVQNLSNLADSLDSASNILDGLADTGLRVSKELKASVESLEDQGRFIAAYNVALGELESRFGPNAVQQLSNYDAANEALQEEFSKAAATLQRELLPALTLITQSVAGLIGLINRSGPILDFLTKVTPGAEGIKNLIGVGNEAARRVTTSPTNAFGFQTGDTGATAAAQKERVAREERSAELVREINRNQERITRARDEASRRELKHQQEILKLAKARADLEAQALEDQARLQKQLIAFQLERARAVEAGNQARLAAQRAIAGRITKSVSKRWHFSSPWRPF